MDRAGHFPMEIIEQILVNVPVKSLIRFRCVSRSWNSLISESRFITKHSIAARKRKSLQIVINQLHWRSELQDSTIISITSSSEEENTASRIVSPFAADDVISLLVSCGEMWCVQVNESIFLWNPSTTAFRKLPDPPRPWRNCPGRYFGMWGPDYDDQSSTAGVIHDYKVLVVPCWCCDDWDEWLNHNSLRGATSELYSLRSNAWKEIQPFPAGTSKPCSNGVLVNGALHWMVYPADSNLVHMPSAIICFHLSSSEYGEVPQPTKYNPAPTLEGVDLTVLNGMLCAFFNYCSSAGRDGLVLWVMEEYGVEESWTKLYDIRCSSIPSITPKFRKLSFTLMPLYMYEDGRVLILVRNFNRESEIILYKNERTVVETVVARDRHRFCTAFLFAETLISP
ncbi:hypothetical protein OROMI_005759 [Orobanche minor]